MEVAAITGRTGERGMRFSIGLPTAAPKIDDKRRSDDILSRCPKGSARALEARAWGRSNTSLAGGRLAGRAEAK